MKAIILAAGRSSRLLPLSADLPKCLLKLHDKCLLRYQLDLLDALGVNDITVAAGYKAELLGRKLGDRARLHIYEDYANTNNLGTLHSCRERLRDDVLILFSDVLADRTAIQDLIADRHDIVLLVDESQARGETMRVKLRDGLVSDIGKHLSPRESGGSFIGMAKLSGAGAALLRTELQAMIDQGGFEQAYYTVAFARLADQGHAINVTYLKGRPWLEVDTPDDYREAQRRTFYLER